MSIKTISTNEWTSLGIDSGTKVVLQSVNGVPFRLSTESTPSSDDDCMIVKFIGMKAADNMMVKPNFASDLPLQISVQEVL